MYYKKKAYRIVWIILRVLWLLGAWLFFSRFNDFKFQLSDLLTPVVILFLQFIFTLVLHNFLFNPRYPVNNLSTGDYYNKETFREYLSEHALYLWIGFPVLMFNNLSLLALESKKIEILWGYSDFDSWLFICFGVYNMLLLICYPYFLQKKWYHLIE